LDKFYQRRGGITFLNESPAKVLPRSPHTLREVLAQPASRVAPSWLNQMILTLIGLAVLAGLVYLAATVPEYAPPNPPYEDGALALTVTPPDRAARQLRAG